MTTFHQWNFFSHTNKPDEFRLSLNSLKGGSKVRLLFLPCIVSYHICNMLLLSSLLSLRIPVREFKSVTVLVECHLHLVSLQIVIGMHFNSSD